MHKFIMPVSAIVLIAAGAAPDLGLYAGKEPFEAVRGVTLFKHPVVLKAVSASVADPALVQMMLNPTGPSGPIEVTATTVKADGCEAHNCGDHHWTIEIGRQSNSATVCYHDVKTTGSQSRWYLGGGRSRMMNGGCFPNS